MSCPPAPTRSPLLSPFLSLSLIFATACAQAGPSLQHKRDVQALLSTAQFDEAAAYIDRQRESYGAPNAVLFHLDRAVALHDAGRYAESDQALDIAEQRMEELYTKSFSKAAGQYFVHDATEDYAGEPYERALLYVYRALNHLFLDQKDEAAVEARKVSHFLSDLRERTDGALSYRDDAFAHLLSAMILEDVGELDNARISLHWAEQAYASQVQPFQMPVPEQILAGLLFRGVEAEAAEAMAAASAEEAGHLDSAEAVSRVDEAGAGEEGVLAAPDTSGAATDGGAAAAQHASGHEAVAARAEAAFARLDEAGADGALNAPEGVGDVDELSDVALDGDDDVGDSSAAAEAGAAGADGALNAPEDVGDVDDVSDVDLDGDDDVGDSSAAVAAEAAPAPGDIRDMEMGEVVLLHYNGLIPHKVERRLQIAGSEALIYVNQYPGEVEGERLTEAGVAALSQNAIAVAFPEMQQVPFQVSGSWVQCLDGACQAETLLVEDIGAIAFRSMSERIDAIRARTIARAAIKFAITKAAEYTAQAAMSVSESTSQYAGLAGALVGLIGRTAAAATEQADTRGWITAPAQIRMARLRLPPGTHDLRVLFVDDRGQVLSSWDMPATQVESGRRTYLHVRTSF